MLRDYKLNARIFSVMRKMKPIRQVEVVEHMIANSAFSYTFVRALLYGTKSNYLIDCPKHREMKPDADAAMNRFAIESDCLLTDLKGIENSFGKDALTLTVCQKYIERLLNNPRVVRYLERKHHESLEALRLWLVKRQLAA